MATMVGYGVSASTHDFFAFDDAGNVWDGTAFVAWVDASFASYRITATVTGTIGGEDRFEADAPTGTARYELRYQGATAALSYLASAGGIDLSASQSSVDANTAALGLLQTEVNKILKIGQTIRHRNVDTGETADVVLEAVP